jgi:hypothetical protein
MKVKGPVACLLATLISVLATVTVAADTDTDSSVTAAHGLRVSKAKEENRALQDLPAPAMSQLREDYKSLKGEARAAALAVKKKKREMDKAKFLLDMETVWEECPRFAPTAEQSCDPSTLTSKCHYGKRCEDADGMCKRRRHCECDAGKFSCTKDEGTCIPCKPLTKKKCEAMLNCNLEGNRGIPVEILEDGPSLRDLTAGAPIPKDWNIKYGKVVGCWDVSQMTNMDHGFWQRRGFNQPLCWDVSKVTSMQGMFYDARFDQDISFWDVSSVTNFHNMFRLNTLDPDDVRAYFNLEDDDEDEDTEGL